MAFTRRLPIILASFLYASLLVVLTAFIEPHTLTLSHHVYTSPQIPPEFNNQKIVLISDIHLGPHFSAARLQRIVTQINQMHPDIVIIAGDLTYPRVKYVIPAITILDQLRPTLGTYLVLGNHDYWREGQLVEQALKSTSIKLLKNQRHTISLSGQHIYVSGVEDDWYSHSDIDLTQAGLAPTDFSLLIAHNADALADNPNPLVDLMLSGHNHGGQVTFFGLYAPKIYSKYGQKFRSGWTNVDNTSVFVTRGLGTIGYPIRLFAPPEISVITLANSPL